MFGNLGHLEEALELADVSEVPKGPSTHPRPVFDGGWAFLTVTIKLTGCLAPLATKGCPVAESFFVPQITNYKFPNYKFWLVVKDTSHTPPGGLSNQDYPAASVQGVKSVETENALRDPLP
jgi:hypothetical protein